MNRTRPLLALLVPFFLAVPDVSAAGHGSATEPAKVSDAPIAKEFAIPVRSSVDGDCFSYWGDNGKNWATLLISKRLLEQIASEPKADPSREPDAMPTRAVQAQRLLNSVNKKEPDVWGCQHIGDVAGAPLLLVYELLESGSFVVIDDAVGKPVSTILVRKGKDKSTFHLNSTADAFLTLDRKNIEWDEQQYRWDKLPRPPWSIEKMPRTAGNHGSIEFAKKFVTSCQSEKAAEKLLFRSHIRLPLKVRFNVVDENGAHGTTEIVHDLAVDPATGGVGLPICIGDGGLDDVSLREQKDGIILELTFGSGPNEELHFKLIDKRWMLVFGEWFDH